jgi:hypothetical protein
MTKADKALVLFLRTLGVGSLFALVPVFMPFSWMATAHHWLGLGEMPAAPVVEYLARSASALYALFGALFLMVASDLDRYRPLVQFLGVAFTLLVPVFLFIDLAAGMPWWWTASEGPGSIVVGAVLFLLARPGHREGGPSGELGSFPNADGTGSPLVLNPRDGVDSYRPPQRRSGRRPPETPQRTTTAPSPTKEGGAAARPWLDQVRLPRSR